MIKTRAGRARAKVESATVERANAALGQPDQSEFCHLLYEEAKRQGVAVVARRIGIQRPALHAALNKGGNPTLGTLLSILAALGLGLRVEEAPGEP